MCEVLSNSIYIDKYGIVLGTTDENIMDYPQATTIVGDLDDVPDDSDNKQTILAHEKCYLQKNTSSTGKDFYKTSSMVDDLKSFAEGTAADGNTCGQGHYIYSKINPITK